MQTAAYGYSRWRAHRPGFQAEVRAEVLSSLLQDLVMWDSTYNHGGTRKGVTAHRVVVSLLCLSECSNPSRYETADLRHHELICGCQIGLLLSRFPIVW
jgi:hypothetical protein